MGYQPLVSNNLKDRAVGAITTADVAFTLQTGNFATPTYKIYLTLDATVDAQFEVVYATVNGVSVSQMERSSAKNHPLSAGLGCEVRMSTPAEIMNALMNFMESGWVSTPTYLTATYVTAGSFTLVGDWTTILSTGDKLKLTNVTTKYFYVKSTSVASNLTTVNVTGGTDYVLASAAITAVQYSKASAPSGHPLWFNYLPTYTGAGAMTYGTVTTTVATFAMIGSTVKMRVQAIGTTGGTASASIQFTKPVTAKDTSNSFVVKVNEGSVNVGCAYSTTTGIVNVERADGANWTLTTGRTFTLSGMYQAA